MAHLLDGDVAQNNGNWQWVAGVGTDAAPYFRILNPTLQARRFDPEGATSAAGSPSWRISPWPRCTNRGARPRRRRGIRPPLVDHADARRRTLARYAAVRAAAPATRRGTGGRSRR